MESSFSFLEAFNYYSLFQRVEFNENEQCNKFSEIQFVMEFYQL